MTSILLSHSNSCQPESIQQPASIRLKPLPAQADTIAALDDKAAQLFEELCYYFEPNCSYVQLPFHLQQEIDNRQWCRAIAQLQVKNLVEVAIGG